jgi:hypothetical protein
MARDEHLLAVLEDGLVGVFLGELGEVGLAGGQHPGDLLPALSPGSSMSWTITTFS